MTLSFIIPAHNEEALLPRTLAAIHRSARAQNRPYEIVVVDDASTDRTAAIGSAAGARVVPVNLRHIAAVRNAGARAATGDVFFFVDADTLVNPATIRRALAALDRGAVGGGAIVDFERPAPLWGYAAAAIIGVIWFGLGWAAGCFIYCTREAFIRTGGFDEARYFAEELYMSKALIAQGRFVLVRPPVVTSGRKFHSYSLLEALRVVAPLARRGMDISRSRELAGWWYDGKRESPSPPSPSGATIARHDA